MIRRFSSIRALPILVITALAIDAVPIGAADWDVDVEVTTAIGNAGSLAQALAVQPDGKIVLAGFDEVQGSTRDFAIVRYLPDGTLDTTFDGDGILLPNFPNLANQWRSASDVVIDSAGRIVVVGTVSRTISEYDIGIARFTSSGQRDTTFNPSGAVPGYLQIDLANQDDVAEGLAVQSDGKLVVVGYTYQNNSADALVIRLNVDGSFDNSFGTVGVFSPSTQNLNEYLRDVEIDPTNRIVVTGYSTTNQGADLLAARITTAGAYDNSFGTGGTSIVSLGQTSTMASKVLITSTGRVVLIGGTESGSPRQMLLVGLTATGSLDPGFGAGGIASTAFTDVDHRSFSAQFLPDGRIIAVGAVQQSTNSYGFALAQFLADGSLDPSFDEDGLKILQRSAQEDFFLDVGLLPDGRVVAAGSTIRNGNYDFALFVFRPRPTLSPIFRPTLAFRATLDPAGGTCVESTPRTTTWTTVFVGHGYLPGATDCTRDGFMFTGWNHTTTGQPASLPLLTDPADGQKRYFAAANLDLTATWQPLPAAIPEFVTFANFLCRTCTTAWLIHRPADRAITYDYTLNTATATCNRSGDVFGLTVCELVSLPTNTPLTITATPRNEHGTGPTTTRQLTLNG